jgi:hypothetical protein
VTFADECLVAIEVASGKVIGKAKIAPRGLAQLLISPSGKRLAGIGSGVFRIWDLASGKLELDGADYSDRSQAGHAWINDRYFVFADSFHSSIFDTQVGGLIWQFWRWEADQMAVLPNYGVWLISPIPQIVVEPFRIPNQALSDLADSLYGRLGNIMGPGAPVRLEITSQNLPEALVTGIQRRLQEVCAENGIQISPGAGSKLKVYINGSTQTQGDLSFANVHLSVRLFDSDDAPHWSFGYPTLRVASNEKVPADYQMIQLPKSISRGPQMNFRGFRAGYNGLQAFRRD